MKLKDLLTVCLELRKVYIVAGIFDEGFYTHERKQHFYDYPFNFSENMEEELLDKEVISVTSERNMLFIKI